MTWIRVFQTLSYITALSIAATFFIPPTSVGGSGNTVIPDSYMKKTLRDHLNKEKFLRHIRDRLMENGRNSTSASSPRRSMFPSFSQDKTSLTNTPATQISHNVTTVGRLVPEKGITSKSFVSGLSYPNLVHSESEEKNVLLFRFKPNTVRNNTLVNRINLWLYVMTKDSKGKNTAEPSSSSSAAAAPSSSSSSSQSLSSSSPSPTTRDLKKDQRNARGKGKRIKIRVFLSDTNGSRGQRIAELKTRIETSSWGKLGLPVSIIHTLGDEHSNNTLRLRIECKRCSRKTQVVMPGNADSKLCKQKQGQGKKNHKNAAKLRRWKKHCTHVENIDEKLFPFLVIEEKTRSAQGRFKRASVIDPYKSNTGCINQTRLENAGVMLSTDSRTNPILPGPRCCTLVKTFVEFSDLNLDFVIVYPSGFEYGSCVDDCGDTDFSPTPGANRNLKLIAHIISETLEQHEGLFSTKPPVATPAHKTHPSYAESYHMQQPQYNQQSFPRHRLPNHKLGRLKRSGICKPTESENLALLHFTTDNRIVQTKLPNFIVTQCGYKKYLPSAKD